MQQSVGVIACQWFCTAPCRPDSLAFLFRVHTIHVLVRGLAAHKIDQMVIEQKKVKQNFLSTDTNRQLKVKYSFIFIEQT